MALSIKDSKTEELARKLAKHRGITMTKAIRLALAEAIANDDGIRESEIERKLNAIKQIQTRAAKLPVVDPAVNADDWMYDENGLPH